MKLSDIYHFSNFSQKSKNSLFNQDFYLKLNRFSDRIRLISLVIFIAIIGFLWSVFDLLPSVHQLIQSQQEISALKTKMETTRSQIAQIIKESGSEDPEIDKKQKDLKNQIEQLNKNLLLFNENIVTQKPLDQMLNALMLGIPKANLQFIALNSTPPENLQGQDAGGRDLYQHNMTLTLQGNYQAMVDYFSDIEDLKLRLLWDSLDYTVTNYPIGTLTLKLSVINAENRAA